jgi:hypothetical protein
MKNLIFHSAPVKGQPRVTVLGNWDEESQEFLITTARCGKKDQFIKKRGVAICLSRLNKGKIYNSLPHPLSISEFVEEAKAISNIIINEPSKVKMRYELKQQVQELVLD